MKITCQSVKSNHSECEDCSLIKRTGTAPAVFHENRTETVADAPALLAVADGVGGLPGGRKASEFVLGKISEKAPETTAEEWKEILPEINHALLEYARNEAGQEKMATTLSLVCAGADFLTVAHTGNTRIQTLNGGYLRQITDDHTTCQWLMDCGNLEAAEKAPKNEIYSCMGAGSADALKRIQTLQIPVTRAQTAIIITSDGVHEYVDTDFLEDTLNRDDISELEKTDIIIREAENNLSEDDKTIMIISL